MRVANMRRGDIGEYQAQVLKLITQPRLITLIIT